MNVFLEVDVIQDVNENTKVSFINLDHVIQMRPVNTKISELIIGNGDEIQVLHPIEQLIQMCIDASVEVREAMWRKNSDTTPYLTG